MKKNYTTPNVEITMWTSSDVITTSGEQPLNLLTSNSPSSVDNGAATITVSYDSLH